MGDSGPFSVGEKVLVPHTDKFYEAKVQKAQKREDGLWYYFLHYLGEHAAVALFRDNRLAPKSIDTQYGNGHCRFTVQ